MMSGSNNFFGSFCDKAMFFSLCSMICVLPVSIAVLDSFAGLAIFFYLLKKINRMIVQWPLRPKGLKYVGTLIHILNGFSPRLAILNRPLQILALAFFISVVFSQYPQLSLYAYLGKYLKYIFLYFCCVEVLVNEKKAQIFLIFFLGSAFIIALSGIFQFYTGKDFIKGYLIRGGRVNSTFFTANGFGAYLLPVIGLTAHLFYTAIIKKKNWILGSALGVLLGVLLACLCWTYSRSCWIGYLIILISMVFLDWHKFIYAGALFLIFIFLFLPSLNTTRHLYLINDNDSQINIQKGDIIDSVKPHFADAGSGRIRFWKKAISIIRTSPIVGTGLNTYARIISRDPSPGARWYAHNCYLQLTAETGVLGIASFLWVLFILLRSAIGQCSYVKEAWPLSFLQGAISGLIGFLLQSTFDNTFYTVQLGILLWMMMGVIVVLLKFEG